MTIPPLSVTARWDHRVCVLAVGGELDLATVPVLAEQAAAALRQSAERLIIDLSGLEFIDSGGVRALAEVTRAAPGRPPVLVRGAGRRVRRLLDLLAVQLEQPGVQTVLDRARWLVLDLEVVWSWVQETHADSRALVAEACQALIRRAAIANALLLRCARGGSGLVLVRRRPPPWTPFTCGAARFTMMSSGLREGDEPWLCRVRTPTNWPSSATSRN